MRAVWKHLTYRQLVLDFCQDWCCSKLCPVPSLRLGHLEIPWVNDLQLIGCSIRCLSMLLFNELSLRSLWISLSSDHSFCVFFSSPKQIIFLAYQHIERVIRMTLALCVYSWNICANFSLFPMILELKGRGKKMPVWRISTYLGRRDNGLYSDV